MRRLSLLLAVAIATPSLAMDGVPEDQPATVTEVAGSPTSSSAPSDAPSASPGSVADNGQADATTRPVDQNVLVADALLAQRLSGTAMEILHRATPTPGRWKQASALLKAAGKLDPQQERGAVRTDL